jgi:hypothetical protein
VLLIAGDDPYDFKGIEDVMHPTSGPTARAAASAEQRP